MAAKKWVSLSKLQRAFSNLANKRLDTLEEIRANTNPAMLAGAATVKELDSSLTNENSETFNFGVLNGVRGFYTDSARGADTFIPFSGNAEIIMTNTPTYTMPEKGKYIIVVSGNIAHRPTLSVNGINKTATEETFQANFSTYTAIYELELNAGDVLSTYWYVLATIKL